MPVNTCIKVPEIMLPNVNVKLDKWSVIACDQYTSNRDYWEQVYKYTGDSPSTLDLVYPEVYLGDADRDSRIRNITETMGKYMQDGTLTSPSPGFIYIERKTKANRLRRGLMAAIDLEQYDYNTGATSLIRATEGTVLDRLPPRICIRNGALLEVPHIMVLIDDPNNTVIGPLAESLSDRARLYDFDLMMNGGHITGYRVDDKPSVDGICSALSRLADPEVFCRKYDVDDSKPVLLFAVGDGNHSLAAAKACWEELKSSLMPEELNLHPARYALVELVNVHDEGLSFEPIHRVLFNIEPDEVIGEFHHYLQARGMKAEFVLYTSKQAAEAGYAELKASFEGQLIRLAAKNLRGLMKIAKPKNNLEVGTLQTFLDIYSKKHKEAGIDYIHGEAETESLASAPGSMGFLLPVMQKHDLFKTVILDGVLPRKTFSMGEADEKRFYLECRKIIK